MQLSVEPGLKGNQGSRVRNLIKPLQFISLVPSIHPIDPILSRLKVKVIIIFLCTQTFSKLLNLCFFSTPVECFKI